MSQTYDSSRRVRTPEQWLTATLLRMVLEGCANLKGALDSFGWPAAAEAMRCLAQAGFIQTDDESGGQVRATV